MKKRVFDAIVIGAGSGLHISSIAAEKGLKVAVIDEGPFGGTCLNRGCIPSKMLIHVADVLEAIRKAQVFGITAKATNVDWKAIQKRVWNVVDGEAKSIELANKHLRNVKVYRKRASFVGHKLLKVGNEYLAAEKIFICAGTRPSLPPFSGLKRVKHETSDTVMRLRERPKSMIILGGGYIAAELGHFFSSLGTRVALINRSGMLVRNEDEEIAVAFTEIVKKKYTVLLNTNVVSVVKRGKGIVVAAEHGGKKKAIVADVLLVATGRRPNTDTLAVEKTGVKVTEDGFVQVNNSMETNVPGIWAIGDIAGKYLFKHSANLEADVCAYNAFHPETKMKVNYLAMPHAVFASPQIAGVGVTEQELKKQKIPYKVGTYKYIRTGMGKALEDEDGFVKVLADPATKKILGCHIIGTDASTLIHEVIVAMRAGLTTDAIVDAVHIHPALPEVVQRAFGSIEW